MTFLLSKVSNPTEIRLSAGVGPTQKHGQCQTAASGPRLDGFLVFSPDSQRFGGFA